MSSTTTKTVKEKVDAIEGKQDERRNLINKFITDTQALNKDNKTYDKQRKEIKNNFLKEIAKIDRKLDDITYVKKDGKKSVDQKKGDEYLAQLANEFKDIKELSLISIGSQIEVSQITHKQSEAAKATHEKLASKVEKATDKVETKEEKQIIKEDIKEGIKYNETPQQIAENIKDDVDYTEKDERAVERVITQEMTKTTAPPSMMKQDKPMRKMMMTETKPETKPDSQDSNYGKAPIETKEDIVEISKVAETEQIRRQEEMPMDFSMGGVSKIKEGKTTLKQLQAEMPVNIQKPNQLLKWINKVGGYENYVYLRSKYGLTDDINGNYQYLQEVEKCIINLYGSDIGVDMANYSNELELKQCIRELNIMRNCLYISKFKAAVGPQYGLVVGLNKVMSLADMLGKSPPIPSSQSSQTMPPNKPVVRGQERLEFEEEKAQLVEGLPQQPQRGRRLNTNPDITPETIQNANLERGTKSEKVAPTRSIHEMLMSGKTQPQQQGMAISRGIKLMKARKQF